MGQFDQPFSSLAAPRLNAQLDRERSRQKLNANHPLAIQAAHSEVGSQQAQLQALHQMNQAAGQNAAGPFNGRAAMQYDQQASQAGLMGDHQFSMGGAPGETAGQMHQGVLDRNGVGALTGGGSAGSLMAQQAGQQRGDQLRSTPLPPLSAMLPFTGKLGAEGLAARHAAGMGGQGVAATGGTLPALGAAPSMAKIGAPPANPMFPMAPINPMFPTESEGSRYARNARTVSEMANPSSGTPAGFHSQPQRSLDEWAKAQGVGSYVPSRRIPRLGLPTPAQEQSAPNGGVPPLPPIPGLQSQVKGPGSAPAIGVPQAGVAPQLSRADMLDQEADSRMKAGDPETAVHLHQQAGQAREQEANRPLKQKELELEGARVDVAKSEARGMENRNLTEAEKVKVAKEEAVSAKVRADIDQQTLTFNQQKHTDEAPARAASVQQAQIAAREAEEMALLGPEGKLLTAKSQHGIATPAEESRLKTLRALGAKKPVIQGINPLANPLATQEDARESFLRQTFPEEYDKIFAPGEGSQEPSTYYQRAMAQGLNESKLPVGSKAHQALLAQLKGQMGDEAFRKSGEKLWPYGVRTLNPLTGIQELISALTFQTSPDTKMREQAAWYGSRKPAGSTLDKYAQAVGLR